MMQRLPSIVLAALIAVFSCFPASGYEAYSAHVTFLQTVTKDIVKLLPRAMGYYIYQNRYDFFRGMTFMTRDIELGPRKLKDLEEVRREAYERLMRDIPYCVEAFEGGDIKLDTSASNLGGRLGMIAYSIILLKMPDFPDLQYLEKFSVVLEEFISENQVAIWLFYDGYPNFNSLGELMERLRPDFTPTFKYVDNDDYASTMREDIFAMFRAPGKFNRNMVLTDTDINTIYNSMVNSILDCYIYIWKCSGMDLAHPSYSAPPGTIIYRADRRSLLSSQPSLSPSTPSPATSNREPPNKPQN
ncbi:MAG: hypothetical protein WCG29_04270 [Desulfomonile sp.]|nr:hypothetical protein [Deltaproteobacteria bacterium]